MPTWTLIGSDDFTETSNTNLENHTPSGANALASAWTHLPFQGGYSLVVNATADAVGQPYHEGSGYRNPYVIGPSANAVQRADCTGIVDGLLGLLLLASSDTTYYKGYLLTHSLSTNRRFAIYRVAAGVATQIKAGSTFDGLIDTDTVSFRVDASGNFTVWVNGVQNTELDVTDTTYTTGKPGIHGAKVSSNTLDNFSAYHEVGGGTTISLDPATYSWVYNSSQVALNSSFTSTVLNWLGKDTQNTQSITHNSALLTETPNSIQNTLAISNTVTTLTDVPTDTQITQTINNNSATLNEVGQEIQNTQDVALASTTLSFLSKEVQINIILVFIVGSLLFTAFSLDVTGAIAVIIVNLLALMGVGN